MVLRVGGDPPPPGRPAPRSLTAKLSAHYRGELMDAAAARRVTVVCTLYFWLTLTTSLYAVVRLAIPFYFGASGTPALVAAHVVTALAAAGAAVNWAAVRHYQSIIGELSTGAVGGDARHCDVCAVDVPARAHHCAVCAACVLKRDHHCFMTGVCVGYHNQRHFVALTAYTALSAAVALPLVVRCARQTYAPAASLLDLLPPVTALQWLRGDVSIIRLVVVSHAHTLAWLGLLAAGFFVYQLAAITQGKTSHELRTNVTVRRRASGGVSANLRDVFGPYWLVGMFAPGIFPLSGDGVRWRNENAYSGDVCRPVKLV